MPVISVLEKLRQEDCQELEAILGYITSSQSTWNRVKSSFIGEGAAHADDHSIQAAEAGRVSMSSWPAWATE